MFNIERGDMTADVDYYYDPATNRWSPATTHAFRIDHRDEDTVGNIKNIWEVARHQHLTVLATAYAVSKDERYALRVADELNNYIHKTPFCRGIHWTSGIELGIRMISWVWIRRLLNDWSDVEDLFENNPDFIAHLGRHHQWLNTFPAAGSSANNHLIAESSGAFIAASAFDIFELGPLWRDRAAATLAKEFDRQTFADGLNKELASDYHGLVLEFATAAYAEAQLLNHPVADELLPTLTRSFDALAAIVDRSGNTHNQGDADDGYGLLLESDNFNRWHSLLATGESIVGSLPWWPNTKPDVRTEAISSCLGATTPTQSQFDSKPVIRPRHRPNQFEQAGQTILRDLTRRPDEIWVRFDHGPHGYLSTAAHAHADALAIEARVGGVPILVDPGTYCYHGESEWRDYFRSTAAHSTIEIAAQNQSQIEGPFLWSHQCTTVFESSCGLNDGDTASCTANHDGYRSRFGIIHRRTVSLDRQHRSLTIDDHLLRAGNQPAIPVRIMFHFHPNVELMQLGSTLNNVFTLRWPTNHHNGQPMPPEQAKLKADSAAKWSLVKGKTAPPLGWYSHILGHREPCWVLVGKTTVEAGSSFSTTLTF